MKIKSLNDLCRENGHDGPSFSTFLMAKSAILKMNNVRIDTSMSNRLKKATNKITLTALEIDAIFEVCPELRERAFQYSA